MDGQRHKPECTPEAAMEGGRDNDTGGHGVDQAVGHIHREEQGAEGRGVAS